MGVRGLTTYLQSDPRNFKQFKLHNTNVVIDANNFLNYLYFSSGLWTQFNGEYCALASNIYKLIKSFKQCNIKPIFIFDGYHEPFKLRTRISRNHQRLQDCRIVYDLFKSNKLDVLDQQYCVRILPPSVNLVFIQTLISLKVNYVTSDTESDQDALSLAIYLKCPVISNDSDFYITIPNSLDVCFIPLDFIKFQPIKYVNNNCGFCKLNSKLCNYLECRRFLPNGPGLNKLPSIQRPLFASLLGNDHISSTVFLNALPGSNDLLIPLNRSANKETYLKRRRTIIKNLINWLSDFNTNREQPINRILGRFPKTNRSYLLKKLNESINSYKTNPSFIFQLFSKYIHLSDIDQNDVKGDDDKNSSDNVVHRKDGNLDEVQSTHISEVDLNNVDDDSKNSDLGNLLDYENEDLGEILFVPISRNSVANNEDQISGYSNDEDNHSVFVRDKDISSPLSSVIVNKSHISVWPENLVSAFRKYLFIPSCLDLIYSSGLINTCFIESFDRESVYVCTDSIRCLIYNILLGLELYLCNHKMREFDEIQILKNNNDKNKFFIGQEFQRCGKWQIKPHKIIIEPFDYLWSSDYVKQNPDFDIQFIQKYIGLIFNYEQSNNWLILLSLISVIQHRTSNTNDDSNWIENCIYILAFCTISICTYLLTSNKASLNFKRLNCHYLKFAELLKNRSIQLMKDKKHSFNSVDINAIHNFGQLQIIYSDLNTLFTLLGCVETVKQRDSIDKKTLIQIPDVVTLFPSGYLYYELCICLNQLQSSERINFIHNFVIDQLLSVSYSADHKSIAIDLFNQFLKVLRYVNDNLCLYEPMSYSEVIRIQKNINHNLCVTITSNKNNKNQSCQLIKSKNKSVHSSYGKTEIQQHEKLSHHEIEERINRIMLENDLSD